MSWDWLIWFERGDNGQREKEEDINGGDAAASGGSRRGNTWCCKAKVLIRLMRGCTITEKNSLFFSLTQNCS